MEPLPETPVLIVGGGPTGLAMSILLSCHGIRSLLVERHPTTARHPKATIINARSMELFRAWGIEAAVRAQGVPQQQLLHMRWMHSLVGQELGNYSLTDEPTRLVARLLAGPAMTAVCPQDVVEPLLRTRAESSALADVRFATELLSFTQTRSGVRATIRDVAGGVQDVQAHYLVAADGAASAIREHLDIAMLGPTGLGHVVNIYFAADLRRLASARPAFLYWLVNTNANGVLIALDGGQRWLLNVPIPEGVDTPAYTTERAQALVQAAVGMPDLAVAIRGISPWRADAQVAEQYRSGRVFLAGDAAHRFPPTGGFGMNTGLQDAHNLAWKLAAVLQGTASSSLLDTYDVERRPIAQSNCDLSAANFLQLGATGIGAAGSELVRDLQTAGPKAAAARALLQATARTQGGHFDFSGQELGFSYSSAAVIADGSPSPVAADPVRDYVPTARPGGRAPHHWIRFKQRVISSLDLFDGFTLLLDKTGAPWAAAAQALAYQRGVKLSIYQYGVHVTDASWVQQIREHVAGSRSLKLRTRLGLLWRVLRDAGPQDLVSDVTLPEVYGMHPGGAVLIRPDGHVAWRTASWSRDPTAALTVVFDTLLGETHAAQAQVA